MSNNDVPSTKEPAAGKKEAVDTSTPVLVSFLSKDDDKERWQLAFKIDRIDDTFKEQVAHKKKYGYGGPTENDTYLTYRERFRAFADVTEVRAVPAFKVRKPSEHLNVVIALIVFINWLVFLSPRTVLQVIHGPASRLDLSNQTMELKVYMLQQNYTSSSEILEEFYGKNATTQEKIAFKALFQAMLEVTVGQTTDTCLTQGLNMTMSNVTFELLMLGGFKQFAVVEEQLRPLFDWMTLRDLAFGLYLWWWWYHGSTWFHGPKYVCSYWPNLKLRNIAGWLFFCRAVKYYNALAGCHQIAVVSGGIHKLHTHKEVWRLFSATWVHSSLMHIWGNMAGFATGNIGALPYAYGKYRFLLGYLFCGLMGSVFSYVSMHCVGTHAVAIGASTALYGVMAWEKLYTAHLCNFGQKEFRQKRNDAFFLFVSELALTAGGARDEARWAIYALMYLYNRNFEMAILNVFLCLWMDNVDHSGHAGGALGGLLLFYLLTPLHPMRMNIFEEPPLPPLLEPVGGMDGEVEKKKKSLRAPTVDTPLKTPTAEKQNSTLLGRDIFIMALVFLITYAMVFFIEKLDVIPDIAVEDYFEGMLGDKELDLV